MDLATFCLRKQWLTAKEFSKTIEGSVKSHNGTWVDGFLHPSLDTIDLQGIESVRPHPFGDVVQGMPEVLKAVLERSGLGSFEDLIQEWHTWHVDNVQPLSDFTLSPQDPRPFGKRIYDNAMEKRACSVEVANSFIHGTDHVVIPEGTSTYWVGLAALARWKNLRVITSNGGLIRELLENPELRKCATSVGVIGGELDVDVGGTGRGFVGLATQAAYHDAIHGDPGATVVVSSVNGLLPDFGPFAPCSVTGFTRHALLRDALDENVRTLVFIADHTKLRSSKLKSYGDPVFAERRNWQRVLSDHLERIAFVVCPPRELIGHTIMDQRPKDRVLHGNGFSQPAIEYLQTAARFDVLCSVGLDESRFVEVAASRFAS